MDIIGSGVLRVAAISRWKEDYNQHRPHSALGNLTPAEYANKISLE